MKKILVVFNGAAFASYVLEQATTLAKDDNSLLMGVFLRPPTPSETIYPFINDIAPTFSGYQLQDATVEEANIIKANITLFRDTCAASKINHSVHLEGGTPPGDLLKESIFADLIAIDANADMYSNAKALLPTSLREFLADSHCPVLVVQENAQSVESVILTYDGSASSMHAIKMYSYLFPHFSNKPTYLVSVNEGLVDELPNRTNVTNWLGLHFTNLQTEVLKGDTKNILAGYIKGKQQNTLVVMGAYGRSAVSRMFRQSLANYIISHTTIPLFITHE